MEHTLPVTPAAPISVSVGTAHDDLVECFRTLGFDSFSQDSDEPGEIDILESA